MINALSLPLFFLGLILTSQGAHGVAIKQCRDKDAIIAAEKLAKSYFNAPKIFHQGRVLKVHNPSAHKEVVAYVETGDGRHYSIFSVVDENCRARFIKRTRQND